MSLRNGRPAKWWHDAVVYEIYVQSFYDSNGDGIGDINGITQKLDYLKDLGVDALWLTPIMASPFADCGYDISDYYKINPDFGTMEDFDNLVSSAHKKGIRIILDMVLTYTSSEHPWFKEACKDKDNRYHDYYVWGSKDGAVPNNWYSPASVGSAWTLNPATGDYYYHAFLPEQPNLNWSNQELVQDMFDVIKFWLDKNIDGYRLDAINYMMIDNDRRNNPNEGFDQIHICDRNHHGAHEILKRIRKLCDFYNRDIMLVGEVYPGDTMTSQEYYGTNDDELTHAFNFCISSLPGKTKRWYDGKTLVTEDEKNQGFTARNFRRLLKEYDLVYRALEIWPTIHIGNHDSTRIFTEYSNFVTPENYENMAKVIAGYNFLSKGTPFMYYGEEIGMESMIFSDAKQFKDTFGIRYYEYLISKGIEPDEALLHAHARSRDKCRTPMQWDSSKNAGFSTNSTTWQLVNPNYINKNVQIQRGAEGSFFEFYKRLIELRKKYDALCGGDYIWFEQAADGFIGFIRTDVTHPVLVILNFNEKTYSVNLDFSSYGLHVASVHTLLSNHPDHSSYYNSNLPVKPVDLYVGELILC